MFRPKLLVIVVVAIAVMVLGRMFLPLPRPEIVLAPEPVFTVASIEVTNTMITAWIVVVFLIIFSWLATRNMKEEPTGLQNLVEAGLEAFLSLVERVAGEKNGRQFFPVVATILIYVLISNWFGLLPTFGTVGRFFEEEHGVVYTRTAGVYVVQPKAEEIESGDSFVKFDGTVVTAHEEGDEAASAEDAHAEEDSGDLLHLEENEKVGIIHPFFRGVNTDLNATLALAITAVVFVQVWGFRSLGLRGYGSKFINVGKLRRGQWFMGFIDLIVGLLEIISEFARMISFTFRLFGNIFAGEVLVFIITFLMPFLLILPFYGLELFVGFIQAFVFAMLTLVFGVMAVAGHGDHAEHSEQAEGSHGH